MEKNIGMETSPLTKELYSIDWAVRFDEFRKFDQGSYSDLNSLLTNIKKIVESELDDSSDQLNNLEVLQNKYNSAKAGSPEWHRLSILINLKIIHSAIPKGLTATATLSAIQIMEHMWKANQEVPAVESKPAASNNPQSRKKASSNKPATKKPAVAAKKKVQPIKSSKPAASKKVQPKAEPKKTEKTENVVIKKLADEVGLDENKPLATRCYEVASSLAEEYPEYTLTAIRVMTAEKLGVTRQYIENLDIRPKRFKNM